MSKTKVKIPIKKLFKPSGRRSELPDYNNNGISDKKVGKYHLGHICARCGKPNGQHYGALEACEPYY